MQLALYNTARKRIASRGSLLESSIEKTLIMHLFYFYLFYFTYPTAQAPITGWIEIFH